MRGATRIAAVAATLVMLAVGAPASGADTTWTKVSGDYNANIVVPFARPDGDDCRGGVDAGDGPADPDIDTVSFTTSPTQDVIGPSASKAAQAWASLDYTHALFTPPGGGLALAFAGIPLDHHQRPADRLGDDVAQRRWQLGRAIRRLEHERGAVHCGALGCHPVHRRVRHGGHRRLQRARQPLADPRPEPSAAARRLLRLCPQDGARQRRAHVDRLVLQRDGKHRRVRAAARSGDRGADRPARARPQQRELEQQQLRSTGGPSLSAIQRSPHVSSDTITGYRSSPFSVSRYSKRSG